MKLEDLDWLDKEPSVKSKPGTPMEEADDKLKLKNSNLSKEYFPNPTRLRKSVSQGSLSPSREPSNELLGTCKMLKLYYF